MTGKSFMDYLLTNQIISRQSFNDCIREQRKKNKNFEMILVENGILSGEQLRDTLGEFSGLFIAQMSELQINLEGEINLSEKIIVQYKIIPVNLKNREELFLASPYLLPNALIDNLKRVARKNFKQALISLEESHQLMLQAYPQLYDALNGGFTSIPKIREGQEQDQAVELVENVLLNAINMRTSDIHLETEEESFKIRFRVDGILQTIETLSKESANAIISRIKVLCNMNIADRRSPQDGGFRFENAERNIRINLRVSTLPCIYGEKVVMRLLPTEQSILSLSQLGMPDEMRIKFEELLTSPHGIIFVTGPTGSGKTNTLYAALKHVRSEENNITTVEDPVELQMSGINQTQVDNANKFTFGKALRTILRQDPNIIMVGEVRDTETAALTLEAALTGHLVLSTLHTNDSTSAFSRLMDMGCEPFLITSALKAVLAQRLVRVICPKCKKPYFASEQELKALGLPINDNTVFYKGCGCPACNGSGYKGRTGVFELFVLEEKFQKMLGSGVDPGTIRNEAVSSGLLTLREDGIQKILQGITTSLEILKITYGG